MIGTIADFLKTAVRWPIRKLGYDIVRYVHTPEQPFNVLRLIVDAQVAAGRTIRFVQIGANDGVFQDPIRDLVVKHRLRGVLVEPLPDLFARLRANYNGQPGLAFEQCAVGEHDGEATLYRVAADPQLPAWTQGIASFDKEHLSGRKFKFPALEGRVESLKVPVLTLPSLLRKHDMDGCELLQIDAEGYDCRIVQAAIRSGLRPGIINYENLNSGPEERAQVKRLLADNAYAFLDIGPDTLAVRSSYFKGAGA
jgi:FkbM family methyltransferase